MTFPRLLPLVFALIAPLCQAAGPRILPLGDSITEGAASFSVYRPVLAKKLADAGIEVEFTGPKQDKNGLRHGGYGGKSVEGVAAEFTKWHAEYPADILLIHSGHNHTVEERPIPGILRATEGIITLARKDNPKVTVLLAQVITSGKLPKYDYIPDLNKELAALAKRLNTPDQPVILVDQATGFDWKTDTIADTVHPNASGAEKMATRWLEALKPLLAAAPTASSTATAVPPEIASLPETQQAALALASKVFTYKTVDGVKLEMHVFLPEKPVSKPAPAALFIHGGGWAGGDPSVHAYECVYLSRQGMVAATIRYRLMGDPKKNPYASAKSPADCLADAKSAMRFFRGKAAELGIDPNRISAGGGSAGGHLVAALATVDGYDDPADDLKISCKPNALVLLYPAFDLVDGWKDGINRCKKANIDPKTFSPAQLADSSFPATLILVGNLDPVSPPASNAAFVKKMKAAKVAVDLFTYAGKEHKLFDRTRTDPHFQSYLLLSSSFYQDLGWIPKREMPALPKLDFTTASSR